jgi:signal transduction histidine kinase
MDHGETPPEPVALRAFVRILMHDIRSSVAAMRLQIELMERVSTAHEDPAIRRGLDGLSRTSRQLLDLVDIASAWAAVDSGRWVAQTARVDVDALVQGAVDGLSPVAARRGVAVEVVSPDGVHPTIETDPETLGAVVRELIRRAIRMSDHGTIVIEHHSVPGGHTLRIRDRAAPHPTGDRAYAITAGAGLGIPRDILHAIGGTLSVARQADDSGDEVVVFCPDHAR